MITAAERDAILAALIAVNGPWDPADVFVGVYEAITDNGIATVIGDVTAPAGDPGVRQAVTTWSAAHIKSDGRAMVDAPAREFRPADATEATVIAGWYAATAAVAGALITFRALEEPIPLIDATTSVSVILRLTVDPTNGRWEDTVVLNG